MQHQDISLGAFDQDRQGFLFAFLDFGLLQEKPFPVIPDIEALIAMSRFGWELFAPVGVQVDGFRVLEPIGWLKYPEPINLYANWGE